MVLKMPRILMACVISSLLLGLTACGEDKQTETTTTVVTTETTTTAAPQAQATTPAPTGMAHSILARRSSTSSLPRMNVNASISCSRTIK